MTSKAFTSLKAFIADQMRMSHIYQPVMLRVLLENNGHALRTDIARAFLNEDRSQIEYYETIVRNMPGRVLSRHHIIERGGRDYRLAARFNDLTEKERQELIAQCDRKLQEFLEKRGLTPWQHRKRSKGYVPGTLRYDVIRRAKGRCEACGVSVEERALEVDHIVPRNRGGTDDPLNLQALCYVCNAQKRDRDDTDFRVVKESYAHREDGCPFCDLPAGRIVRTNELTVLIRDKYPVVDGHSLVVPRRHVSDYFALHQPELNAIDQLLRTCREELMSADRTICGFNVGINSGEVAGQTVGHAHVHLIPRRHGDVSDPRGGVRGVILGKQKY